MLYNKIILIGILLTCIPSVLAWDSEGGYAEGEEIELEYVEGYHYFTYTTPEDPHWYDPLINLWIRISSYLFTDEEIEVEVTVVQEIWSGTQYEPTDPQVRSDNTRTLRPDANQSSVTNMALDPIEEFFKNNTDVIETFKTRNDDSEHPDILNVSLNITGAGLDIHEHGYTTLNDAAMDSIDDTINSPDYGFVTSGRGSDAGSGGIYTGLNVYSGEGDGTAEGMGGLFTMMFYTLIPILFIICVFKFISKAMSK